MLKKGLPFNFDGRVTAHSDENISILSDAHSLHEHFQQQDALSPGRIDLRPIH